VPISGSRLIFVYAKQVRFQLNQLHLNAYVDMDIQGQSAVTIDTPAFQIKPLIQNPASAQSYVQGFFLRTVKWLFSE
jgi:hypothetical protein